MKNLTDLFMSLVQIDSETCNEDRFMKHLQDLLTREFGAECSVDSFGNLLAKIAAKNSSKPEPILLSCHGDTVKPGKGIKPVLKDGVIRSSGDTILGADDKAGIAEVIWALKTTSKHPPIEFVITRQEESGLIGAKNFDISTLRSKMGFLMDSDEPERIVVGGPCKINFDVEFIGKAAHAGMEPEKGISAIHAAAKAIAMMQLGRIDHETTANIGIINGGINRNGVPDKCTVVGEARGMNNDRARAQADHMEECFKRGAEELGAKVNINREEGYQAVVLDKNAEPLKIAREALASIGLNSREEIVGGGTDASIYNAAGLPTVVLGIGAKAEHTVEESVAVADMEIIVKILHKIFELTAI